MSRILIIAIVALVAGCGFQLQGALTIPPEMERMYVVTDDRHSLFYRKLRVQLQAAGVSLVDAAADSTATLSILRDETDQRVLSVSARNVPTEYEVFYTIEYAIDGASQRLLDARMLTGTRDYTYDPELVLGKSHEEELMREAIADDLVRIVLKQISRL